MAVTAVPGAVMAVPGVMPSLVWLSVPELGSATMVAPLRGSPPALPVRVMARLVVATTDTVWAVAIGRWRMASARSAWPGELAGMAIANVPPLDAGVVTDPGVSAAAQGSYQVAW